MWKNKKRIQLDQTSTGLVDPYLLVKNRQVDIVIVVFISKKKEFRSSGSRSQIKLILGSMDDLVSERFGSLRL